MQETWFDPWVGKISQRRERLSILVFWPGEFHGLQSPWGHKELDMTEQLSLMHLKNSLYSLLFQWFWGVVAEVKCIYSIFTLTRSYSFYLSTTTFLYYTWQYGTVINFQKHRSFPISFCYQQLPLSGILHLPTNPCLTLWDHLFPTLNPITQNSIHSTFIYTPI